jgi:hypothetical protein
LLTVTSSTAFLLVDISSPFPLCDIALLSLWFGFRAGILGGCTEKETALCMTRTVGREGAQCSKYLYL